jgi:hypothetical protein
MRNPGGHFHQFDPDPHRGAGQQAVTEHDTSTCAHCGHITIIRRSVEQDTGWCFKCTRLICLRCVALGGCDPIEAKLGRWEEGK